MTRTRPRADRSLLAFFVLAFAISWGALGALQVVVTGSGLGGWLLLRTLAGGGLGEELGWRGWALPRLEAHLPPVATSALLGLVWALWHLPSVLVAASPVLQGAVLLLFIAPMAFLHTWVFNGTGGSLSVVVLTLQAVMVALLAGIAFAAIWGAKSLSRRASIQAAYPAKHTARSVRSITIAVRSTRAAAVPDSLLGRRPSMTYGAGPPRRSS